MPIYEYECSDCNNTEEILILKKGDKSNIKCSNCGSLNLKKSLSSFAVVNKTAQPAGCCGSTSPCDNPRRCCTK